MVDTRHSIKQSCGAAHPEPEGGAAQQSVAGGQDAALHRGKHPQRRPVTLAPHQLGTMGKFSVQKVNLAFNVNYAQVAAAAACNRHGKCMGKRTGASMPV